MGFRSHKPWLGLVAAALILPTASSTLANASAIEARVIYGTDDRLEIADIADARVLDIARSTAGMFWRSDLKTDGAAGMTRIKSIDFGTAYGLCSDEPFFSQPAAADCSGFLVAPDVIATAGHCVPAANRCSLITFVFSFEIDQHDRDPSLVPTADVYACKEVIGTEVRKGGADWALVRLDRAVSGRLPLRLRGSGEVKKGDDVFVIGHPAGLPKKFAGGAKVRETKENAYFSAELDTYGGNSGSAVFNAQTFDVEGILVRGESDFENDGKCVRSKVCASGTCMGEEITRIREIFPHLPQ